MKSSETDVKDSLQNHPKHFDRKKNASAYTLPKKNLTKVFNYYQKKPTLSPNYIHMYKIVEKCAHYQQAHVILEKTKSIQNCDALKRLHEYS